jgi:hypothetical protein
MPTVNILITKFVDNHQPGFVECLLIDAGAFTHTFIEKIPIVTTANLWSTSDYPQSGYIDCVITRMWIDEMNRELIEIDTSQPWHIESVDGENRFIVLASQITMD